MNRGAKAFLVVGACLSLCAVPAFAGAVAPVAAAEYPWSGTVRVTTNIGSSCTGALVGRSTVVTAAHCLYNKRTGAMLSAVSLHVLFGYDRGDFRLHSLVAQAVTDPAYRPGEARGDNVARDWAVLSLATPAPESATILPVIDSVAVGTVARMAGFRQSKGQILTGDADCAVRWLRPAGSGAVIGHDCASEHGVSGAPLLVRQDGRWAVAGVLVGTLNGQPGLAVAAGAAGFRATLATR